MRSAPLAALLLGPLDPGHGRGPFDVPPLPPGSYQVLTVAIDWEDGDPPPQPRIWPIHLLAGETGTVLLKNRLVDLEVR